MENRSQTTKLPGSKPPIGRKLTMCSSGTAGDKEGSPAGGPRCGVHVYWKLILLVDLNGCGSTSANSHVLVAFLGKGLFRPRGKSSGACLFA